MDIFGTVASAIDLASKITTYIQAVKGAKEDRRKLHSEVSTLGGLLGVLQGRLDNDDDISNKLIEAGIRDPLLQCYEDLRHISEELEHIASPVGARKSSSLLEIMKDVAWPFRQEDIRAMLDRIERLKSLISLALQTSLIGFVKETRNELKNLGLDHMKAIVSALEGAREAHTKETESISVILRDLVAEFQGFANNASEINDAVATITRNQQDHMMKGDRMQADLTIIRESMYNQEHQDLVKWLSPLDFGEKHNAIFEKRARDTGEWFLQHPKFLAWRRGDPEYKTLWCPGNPGVGKSVMASLVINELRRTIPENTNTGLVFIYFEYKTKHTISQLAEVVLKQLARRQITQSSLKSLRKHKAEIRPTSGELFEMWKTEVGTYERVLVVIDALDEADPGTWAPLLRNLQALPNIGILATSRDVSEIGLGLQPHQRLDIVADEGDVRKYIEGRLASGVKFKQLLKERLSVHGEIITGVMAKADGMFLLAQLHMNTLETKLRVADLRRALGTLPNTLDATYDEATSRINEDHKELAYRIISWLIHAARPMTIQDLQYAMAIEDEMTDLPDADDLYDEAFLTSICVGLVVLREDTANMNTSKIVGLVHYTAQQYFLGNPSLSVKISDSPNFATSCLRYLTLDIFKAGLPLDEESTKQLMETPFASYAMWSWGVHARGHWGNKVVRDLATELLDNNQRVVMVGSLLCHAKISAIHLSIYFGLEDHVKSLLDNGCDVNSKDSDSDTTVSYAAIYGQEEIMRLLLAKEGVNINPMGWGNYTPLARAILKGHEAIVQLLLARNDLDVNLRNNSGHTPVFIAASRGHSGIVELLLARDDVDINLQDQNGSTPLSIAADWGHEVVVRLLLARNDLDINLQDQDGDTPLLIAAYWGHKAVVRLLLVRNDLDVNLRNNSGGTPVLIAASKGHSGIVELLLARDGVDINLQNQNGDPPLLIAASRGHEAVVRLLLARNDLDINLQGQDGDTAVLVAAFLGHSGIMELLLARDSMDINLQNKNGDTPLLIAADRGHEAIVRLLLARNDLDVNLRNDARQTPVFIAASKGHSGIAERLLARGGVDINSQRQYRGTPLSVAISKGHKAIIRLLLARADLDTSWKNMAGITYLAIAASYNNEEVVKWFLAKGNVDVNLKGRWGRGALALAAMKGSNTTLELLLDQNGININPVDVFGKTPLDHAIHEDHARTIELLRAAGGRTNMRELKLKPFKEMCGNVCEDGNGDDKKDNEDKKDEEVRRDDDDRKDEEVRKGGDDRKSEEVRKNDEDKKDKEARKDDEDETARVDREDEDNGQDGEVREVEVNMKEGDGGEGLGRIMDSPRFALS